MRGMGRLPRGAIGLMQITAGFILGYGALSPRDREIVFRLTGEFYGDATIGEFWIGPRPALAGRFSSVSEREER